MDSASSFVCKCAAINRHIATTKNTVKKPRKYMVFTVNYVKYSSQDFHEFYM